MADEFHTWWVRARLTEIRRRLLVLEAQARAAREMYGTDNDEREEGREK